MIKEDSRKKFSVIACAYGREGSKLRLGYRLAGERGPAILSLISAAQRDKRGGSYGDSGEGAGIFISSGAQRHLNRSPRKEGGAVDADTFLVRPERGGRPTLRRRGKGSGCCREKKSDPCRPIDELRGGKKRKAREPPVIYSINQGGKKKKHRWKKGGQSVSTLTLLGGKRLHIMFS